MPYLGPLKEGERINERGYLVRKGNRTIYPSTDMTLLIKVTGESGRVGWGECYGIVAPEATKAIIDDVLGPVIIGRDPGDAVVIHEDLYDLRPMCRGCLVPLCRNAATLPSSGWQRGIAASSSRRSCPTKAS